MIEKICFRDLSKSKYAYLNELLFFKEPREIHFTDGVNVIFAPVGAGKSSILNILANTLACHQGGVSKITRSHVQKIIDTSLFSDEITCSLDGIDVHHDGQEALYYNARKSYGLDDKKDFDDDFIKLGIDELLNKRSSGQETMARGSDLQNALTDLNFLSDTIKFDEKLSVSEQAKERVKSLIAPKIKKGKKTLLLDEPEISLSALYQYGFFNNLANNPMLNEYQWIIVTHSPFVKLIKDLNYIHITTEDLDYLEQALTIYKTLLKDLNY